LSLCENVMIALVPFEIEPVGLIGVGQYEGGGKCIANLIYIGFGPETDIIIDAEKKAIE